MRSPACTVEPRASVRGVASDQVGMEILATHEFNGQKVRGLDALASAEPCNGIW